MHNAYCIQHPILYIMQAYIRRFVQDFRFLNTEAKLLNGTSAIANNTVCTVGGGRLRHHCKHIVRDPCSSMRVGLTSFAPTTGWTRRINQTHQILWKGRIRLGTRQRWHPTTSAVTTSAVTM